ncbi:hypothetical protein LC609_03815 [Nostoc sp. XA013]|nr:hypothetical protein [Nostoc sp. XA013]
MAPQEPTKGELIKNLDALEICRVNPLLLFFHSGLSKVKAKIATGQAEVLTGKVEAATDCAIHGNVKVEAATDCAIHGNVKAEAATGKAEAATDCAIHGNVKAEAAPGKPEALTGKAEAAMDCAIHFILPLNQQCYKKTVCLGKTNC